jgi:hypothetical protein
MLNYTQGMQHYTDKPEFLIVSPRITSTQNSKKLVIPRIGFFSPALKYNKYAMHVLVIDA